MRDRWRRAFLRALTYSLSLAPAGIGLLGVVFGRERRAWRDHIAGSAVDYDWGTGTVTVPTPLARYLEPLNSESPSAVG